MLLTVFEYIKMFLAFLLTAFIIKLIDDYIDVEDSNRLFNDLINNMRNGIAPYILVVFSISCLLNNKLSISIFISSYIIGMFNDFNRTLSFKLKGYQESALILFISVFFLGKFEMISSFLLVFLVQLLDDLIDYKKDKYYGRDNFCLKFGYIEVIILSFITILLLFKLSYIKLIFGLITFILFQSFELKLNRGK